MTVQGNGSVTGPGVGGVKRVYTTAAPARTGKSEFARRFDSVSITGAGEDGVLGSAGMEIRSRLTQEVRAAGSTESVAALKEQVRSGTYRPDAMEIARRMLLIGEDG